MFAARRIFTRGAHAMAEHMGRGPKPGAAFPNVRVDIGFVGLDPANAKQSADLVKGKKCLVVTLPGAFTPT